MIQLLDDTDRGSTGLYNTGNQYAGTHGQPGIIAHLHGKIREHR